MTAGVAVNLFVLVGLVAWILRQAYPATEAVRLRNAILVEPSRPGDFAWTPANVPAGFARESLPENAELSEIMRATGVHEIFGDWEKALALCGHLTERAQDRGPIGSDLMTTYRRIREGYGYCADFVKVFLALAHAAGLFARQWAFSFDGFGGHGHTFVEVFDSRRGKWLFLDVYNNFHAVDGVSGEPLSAVELRAFLEGRLGAALIRPNGPGRPGFVHLDTTLDYYRRGLPEWYLWWGNAVLSSDANALVRWTSHVGGGLGRILETLLGTQPRIRILSTPTNGDAIAALKGVRSRIRMAGFLFAGLLIILVFQLSLASALWAAAG
jgi:hypothetical protein